MNWVKCLSREKMQKIWACNDQIADLNYERFREMELEKHFRRTPENPFRFLWGAQANGRSDAVSTGNAGEDGSWGNGPLHGGESDRKSDRMDFKFMEELSSDTEYVFIAEKR